MSNVAKLPLFFQGLSSASLSRVVRKKKVGVNGKLHNLLLFFYFSITPSALRFFYPLQPFARCTKTAQLFAPHPLPAMVRCSYIRTAAPVNCLLQQKKHISRASYVSVAPSPVTSVVLNILHTSAVTKLPPSACLPGRLAPTAAATIFRVVVRPVPHLGCSRTEQAPKSKAHTAAYLDSLSRAGPVEIICSIVFFLALLLCCCITHVPLGSVLVAVTVQQQQPRCEPSLCDSHRRCFCLYVYVYLLLHVPSMCVCVACVLSQNRYQVYRSSTAEA